MSKQYTEPITLNKGRVWFTVEEELWLNRWRPEVQRLNSLEGPKVKQAQTKFYNTLVAEFLKGFPYRDPDHNPDWIFTSKQLQLAMKPKDWQALRNVRLCHSGFPPHRIFATSAAYAIQAARARQRATGRASAEREHPCHHCSLSTQFAHPNRRRLARMRNSSAV